MKRTITKVSYFIEFDKEECRKYLHHNAFKIYKETEGLHLKKKVPAIPYKEKELVADFHTEREAQVCLANL